MNDSSCVRNRPNEFRDNEDHASYSHAVTGTPVILELVFDFMVVKVRFGQGPVVSRGPGKNSRLATLTASILTLVSISCGSLALWRIGTDLDWAGDFAFPSGLLSHWQVWMGAAIGLRYLGWRLGRYARKTFAEEPEVEAAEESPRNARAIANV
jgi:hypothetical protein